MIDDEHFRNVKQAAVVTLFKIPGVRSVAIGPKYSNGQATGEMAIIVGVERKRPAAEVPLTQMIQQPSTGSKRTSWRRRKKFPFNVSIRWRTTPGTGLSSEEVRLKASNPATCSNIGTMGFVGFTTGAISTVAEDLIVGVTCQHVLADSAGAALMGQNVGQAGMTDCSACSPCCDDIIGKVLYAVDRAPDNSLVDAALIDLHLGLEYYNDVQQIGAVSGFHAISQRPENHAPALPGEEARTHNRPYERGCAESKWHFHHQRNDLHPQRD